MPRGTHGAKRRDARVKCSTAKVSHALSDRVSANNVVKTMDGFYSVTQPVASITAVTGRAIESQIRGQNALKAVGDFDDSAKSYGVAAGLLMSVLTAIVVIIKNNLQKNKTSKEKEYREMRRRVNAWYDRFRAFYRLGNDVGQLTGNIIPSHWRPLRSVVSTVTGMLFGVIGVIGFKSWGKLAPCALLSGRFDDLNAFERKKAQFPFPNGCRAAYAYLQIGNETCLYYLKRDETTKAVFYEKALSSSKDAEKQSLLQIAARFHINTNDCANNAFRVHVPALKDAGLGLLAHHITVDAARHRMETGLFQLGKKDGWSRYTKVGAGVGASLGSALFGLIGLFVPLPFSTPVFAAIGSAVGGILGFVAPAALVPLVNWIAPKHDQSYRVNYAKVGSIYGGAIGGVIGFVIGWCIPFPGLAAVASMIGSGIGASIGALVFSIAGPNISRHLGDNHSSSWDYGMKSAAAPGYQTGLGVAAVLNQKKIGGGHDVKQLCASIGNLVAATIGGVYDAYQSYRAKKNGNAHAEATRVQPLLPWSQRLGTCSLLLTGVGSVLGFIIGGPFGMAIGAAVGGFLSPFVAIGAGDEICLGLLRLSNAVTDRLERFFSARPAVDAHQSSPCSSTVSSPVSDRRRHLHNASTGACTRHMGGIDGGQPDLDYSPVTSPLPSPTASLLASRTSLGNSGPNYVCPMASV